MDPILFKKQLQPLDKDEIDRVLAKCYPLRGSWTWDIIEGVSKNILRIFTLVHQQPEKYLVVEPDWITDTYVQNDDEYDYDKKWGICWDKKCQFTSSYLYKSLEDLLDESESSKTPDWDDYGTSSESSSDETVSLDETDSIKEIEFSTTERDQKWRDCNPAFNPRFLNDLKSGNIQPPAGFNVEQTIEIIKGVCNLDDGMFLAADNSGDISDSGHSTFGLYGKPRCMKSVKMIRFFEIHALDYSLDIDVKNWVEKAEKRTNIWKWIRVGPGFYRDFDWMFLGDQDCIMKTVQVMKGMGYTPLSDDRESGYEFDFDPADIFKLSAGKCLNIDTGESIISKKADPYRFVTKKKNIKRVRGYIFDYFVKQYPERWISGKKNRWATHFFSLLKKGTVIDFETLKPIKYTATTNLTHNFSKLGFALSKSEENFKMKDIEKSIVAFRK